MKISEVLKLGSDIVLNEDREIVKLGLLKIQIAVLFLDREYPIDVDINKVFSKYDISGSTLKSLEKELPCYNCYVDGKKDCQHENGPKWYKGDEKFFLFRDLMTRRVIQKPLSFFPRIPLVGWVVDMGVSMMDKKELGQIKGGVPVGVENLYCVEYVVMGPQVIRVELMSCKEKMKLEFPGNPGEWKKFCGGDGYGI